MQWSASMFMYSAATLHARIIDLKIHRNTGFLDRAKLAPIPAEAPVTNAVRGVLSKEHQNTGFNALPWGSIYRRQGIGKSAVDGTTGAIVIGRVIGLYQQRF